MSTYAAAALQSFLFGVVTGLAVGPIALFIIQQSIARGFGVGLRCALGASLADLTYAVVAFTAGATLLPYLESARGTIRLIGSLLLLALGAWIVASALGRRGAPHAAHSTRRMHPTLLTYLLTIANPMTIVFMIGLASQLPLVTASLPAALGLAACVFAGTFLCGVVFSLGGAGLGRVIERPGVIRALEVASGLGIVGFGVRGVVVALRG